MSTGVPTPTPTTDHRAEPDPAGPEQVRLSASTSDTRTEGQRALFSLRAVLVLACAAALAVSPGLGQDRWVVAAGLVLLAPLNLVGLRLTKRFGRVPLVYPFADITIAGAAVLLVEDLWVAALLAMLSSLALTATLHELRRVLPVLAYAVLMALVVTASTQDGRLAGAGLAGFLGASALTVVSTVSNERRSRSRYNRSAVGVDGGDAVAWTLRPGASHYESMTGPAQHVMGYPIDAVREADFHLGRVAAEDRDAVSAARQRATSVGVDIEYRFLDAAGRTRWLREVLLPDGDPGRERVRGITFDVTAKRSVDHERELYHHVVQHLSAAIIVARASPDGNGALRVAAANPAADQLYGTPAGSLVGTPLGDLLHDLDPSALTGAQAVAGGADPFTVERVEGLGIDRQKTFSIHVFGLPGRAVGVAIDDVTGAAMVAAALRRQALHDGLTGLPNRTLLRDRLRYALADAKRRNERVALILLDLNHFKEVNDALGHQYGDRLLSAFARRLQNLLRECDTIARLGGDEFALLLTHATNDGASRVVEKVTEAMLEPFELDGVTVQTTASLGVALYPDHGTDGDTLTQRADAAMYAAKRSGGGWAFYSPAQDQSSTERLSLLADLHHELDELTVETMTLHYQPVLDLSADRIVAAEALLRWQHPTLGTLDPELVVELAELSGLVGQLGRFVAREATQTAARWRAAGHQISVAVNLSARNLYDRTLVRGLSEALTDSGLPASALRCELAESEVMDDPVLAMDVIGQLGEIGIRTTIDGFGTGYSSLAYLRRLPVDEIKIDKSFVKAMMDDDDDLMIVRTIIDLGHNLGLSVVADGVEDEATLEALRSLGCDQAQGLLVGRPSPGVGFLDLVEDDASIQRVER